MFGFDVRVCVRLLVRFVGAVEEGTPEHRLFAALVRHVPPVRALVPILPLALLAFVRSLVLRPKIFSLHRHYGQHTVHHRLKEIHFT